jgi:hypothetical protein
MNKNLIFLFIIIGIVAFIYLKPTTLDILRDPWYFVNEYGEDQFEAEDSVQAVAGPGLGGGEPMVKLQTIYIDGEVCKVQSSSLDGFYMIDYGKPSWWCDKIYAPAVTRNCMINEGWHDISIAYIVTNTNSVNDCSYGSKTGNQNPKFSIGSVTYFQDPHEVSTSLFFNSLSGTPYPVKVFTKRVYVLPKETIPEKPQGETPTEIPPAGESPGESVSKPDYMLILGIGLMVLSVIILILKKVVRKQ